MNDTRIEWAHDTLNLWWGCTEVSPQCDHCYARTWDKRLGGDHWGERGPRLIMPGVWRAIQKTQAQAAATGEIRLQFVMSMGDIFERDMPLVDRKGNPISQTTGDLRNRLFTEVIPQCPNLVFLLLTKRPQNITRMIPPSWQETPPPNVMFGASVGTGDPAADTKAILALLQAPGQRFLSCEPLLGPVELPSWDSYIDPNGFENNGPMTTTLGYAHEPDNPIDWVIVGGESGTHARPMHPAWLRSLRDQCVASDTPFFFKQWGEWVPPSHVTLPMPQGTMAWPWATGEMKNLRGDTTMMFRVGKKHAGRTLDGVTWDQFPKLSPPLC